MSENQLMRLREPKEALRRHFAQTEKRMQS